VLDLSQLDRMNAEYRDRPLTGAQAQRIASHLASRFLRRNDKEWRAYNRTAQALKWPASGRGPRVLAVPSSRNEVEGHRHWAHGWDDLTAGLDAVFDAVGAFPQAAVLRCHPNWGERIGRRTGALSERHYADWARRRGEYLIGSSEAASTHDLMAQADLVIVTGGSAAFEASCLGKPVISLTPSAYRTASIATHVTSSAELPLASSAMDSDPHRVRRGLRYGYTHSFRFSQYVDFVRAVSTTRYRYFDGADPAKIELMLRAGAVPADDAMVEPDAAAEDEVLALLAQRDWARLIDFVPPVAERRELRVARRLGLGWIDDLRQRLPIGDRGR
jgi:hypothetical protein